MAGIQHSTNLASRLALGDVAEDHDGANDVSLRGALVADENVAALHAPDAQDVDVILVRDFDSTGPCAAVRSRLTRAAGRVETLL